MKIPVLFLIAILWFTSCKKPTPVIPTPVENLPDPKLSYYSSSANVGDTVLLIGENFSLTARNNVVTFGKVSAAAFQSIPHTNTTYDSLKVVVPIGATTDHLKLIVNKKQATSFYTFYITTGKWVKMANCPEVGHADGTAFAVGNNGYVGLGNNGNGFYSSSIWQFNPTSNSWSKKTDYPLGQSRNCTSFVIGNKAYVGLGLIRNIIDEFTDNRLFYEFDPVANIWTQKAIFRSTLTTGTVSIAVGSKGYVFTGGSYNQFLTYDSALNTWIFNLGFPGGGRRGASGFVINDEVYYGGGYNGSNKYINDVWRYNPVTEKWTELESSFPFYTESIDFAVNGKGYRLVENNRGEGSSFYEYDPTANQWFMKKAFPRKNHSYQLAFTVNNRAFVTCGIVEGQFSGETWEFIP